MSSSVRPLLMALAALAVLTGCTSLPESGQVEVLPESSVVDPEAGFPYEPRPPQPGESPTEIVRHFLDAMTANPITTSVARQFLTEQARDQWRPDAGIITYADLGTPIGGTQIRVGLMGAHRIDAGGRWAGAVDPEESVLDFELVTEDGEWRIDDLPDAMVVPDNWFNDRYVQKNLHFFDPSGRILVPEPVFVPRGGQGATSLVRGLLRGPAEGLGGVQQSFVPSGLSLDVLVPDPADGFTEVALTGEVPALDRATVDLMVAQFAWTLRQVPDLIEFRLTLNGTPLGASGVAADVSVLRGEPYAPTFASGWTEAFAIRDDRLVNVSARGVTEAEGEHQPADWRSFAVDLQASRIAWVEGNGRQVGLAPLNGSLAPSRLLSGTDLLKPAWDHTGTVWLLDRTSSGAKVFASSGEGAREIRVPGVSGKRVKDFLVSRDGSRIVALVGGRSDRVVSARIVRGGGQLRATAPTQVWADPDEGLSLHALGWRSPTDVLVVRRLGPELSQVVRRSVDGSDRVAGGDVSTELVRDKVVELVSSPVADQPAWVVGADGDLHVVASTGDPAAPSEALRALTYPG